MQTDRFSRIVRELDSEGYVYIDGSNLTVYNGDQRGAGDSSLEQPSLLPAAGDDLGPGGGVEGVSSREEVRRAIDEVLATYVDVMQPRSSTFGEDDRREVGAALKIRTVDQCQKAVYGCKASDYHMGNNRRNRKYNRITNIFKGKRGGRTRGEQIDMFIELYEKAKGTGRVVSSADPAVIATRKEEVRRAHRFRDDPEAVERGSKAEQWLLDQGIETRRRADGYPIWPEGD